MPDIVDVIKSQHRQVEILIARAQDEKEDTLAVLEQIKELLVPHSRAEEAFVYPRIAELQPKDEEEVQDGAAEHHHVESLLQELLAEDPEGPGYDGKLAAMAGELQHHVEEEEEDLLPVLSDKASDEERADMASRFLQETTDTSPLQTDASKAELYEQAQAADIPGRSQMTKAELAEALDQA